MEFRKDRVRELYGVKDTLEHPLEMS